MSASPTQIAQANLILKSAPDAAAFPPDWDRREGGEVEWFHRKGTILVREVDVARVREVLPQLVGDRRVEIRRTGSGVTALTWATAGGGADDGPSVVEVLRALAGQRETADVEARPDHLLYVCVHCCAAIEPEVVPAGTHPHPALPAKSTAPPLCGHGRGARVTVLDTGLVEKAALEHPWLAGVTGDPETSFVPGGGDELAQDAGHGTFTAGCVRVTAPAAGVEVLNAVDLIRADAADDGEMIGAAFESDLSRMIRDRLIAPPGAQPHPVPDVLLINFAGRTLGDAPPLALVALYETLLQHLAELVVVAPAGNDGDDRKNWPAAFDWVVSVGALDAGRRARAPWSCFGRTVDVWAPGDGLVNAYAHGRYTVRWEKDQGQVRQFEGMARWSGTSFAAPLVAGLIAARMSTTGQSSRRAWESLADLAQRQAVGGVGAVLLPGIGCCAGA
jgi:Subtilase family